MSVTKRNSPPCAEYGRAADHLILHETAFPVPPLRPGIGMDQIDARQECGGSQPIRLTASSKCRRILCRLKASMAASALAMPLTNGSTPMKPFAGMRLRLRDHVRRRRIRSRA
jgi:hypothetical protein